MRAGRRQQELDAFCRHTRWGAGVLAMVLNSGAAHGQDCWRPDVLSPVSGGIASPSFVLASGADAALGFVPPFRAGERTRAVASVSGGAFVAPFELRANWGWIVDASEGGGVVSGPGDLRLGTIVTLARPGAFDVTAGWEVKLPNAADEGELGTDETDVTLGVTAGWSKGPVAARLGAGLAVLGNPLRFANQDDVPVARGSLAWDRGPVRIVAEAAADLPTPRNPARIDGDVAFRYGTRWFVLVHGGGGFVPASADAHVGLAVGFASALPNSRSGV